LLWRTAAHLPVFLLLDPASFPRRPPLPPATILSSDSVASSVHTDGITITRHVGRSGIQEVAGEWTRLTNEMARRWFLHLPEWHASYAAALERDDQILSYYAIRSNGQLHAIVPLKTARLKIVGLDVPVLTLPKHDHVPFCDVIAHRDANLEALGRSLFHHLKQSRDDRWDLLVLPHVLNGACAEGLVAGMNASRLATRSEAGCDYIVCEGAAGTRDIATKNMRGNLRRTGNKLRRHGDISFEVHRSGEGLRAAYRELLKVEASGWKGDGGTRTAIALHPELVRFYDEILDRFEALGAVEISVLRASGQCIAAQLALLIDRVWYQLKIGYDDVFKNVAPGNLIMEQLLDRLCAHGVTEANLLSNATWHASWNPKTYPASTYFVANGTPRGLGMIALLRLRKLVRRDQPSSSLNAREMEQRGGGAVHVSTVEDVSQHGTLEI